MQQTKEFPHLMSLGSMFLILGLSNLMNTDPASAVTNSSLHDQLLDTSGIRDIAEGPEFWENVRRYGFYALTVSTGALYSFLKPIAELLKKPVTGILAGFTLVGVIYLLYITLSSMLGVTGFSYDYDY